MNKKNKIKILLIIVAILIIIISLFLLHSPKSKNNTKDNRTNNEETSTSSLVLYFSVTKNTEKIAKYIKNITNSDLIEIIPKEEYTNADINYSNPDSRATKEQNNTKARPSIKNKIDIDKYDTIYLGYPIWWGDVPKIILTLIDNYNLENKTIIPFCTSGSTDISNSIDTLRNYNDKLNIIEGRRFSNTSTKEEVKNWLDSINE